jgi:hypothetical protein
MGMTRTKKPDAPKFEPVTIAGYRLEGTSLAMSEAESAKIREEDFKRIVAESMTADLTRLKVLQKYLGLEGELGDVAHLLMLLIAVANKYVPGFAVEGSKSLKSGPMKIADRFKTVTEVERLKFERGLSSISAAIDAVAAERRPAIRPPELSTKYYACRREIEANQQAAALLHYWRLMQPRLDTEDLQFFDSLFWQCESNSLGATTPHNVEQLKPR